MCAAHRGPSERPREEQRRTLPQCYSPSAATIALPFGRMGLAKAILPSGVLCRANEAFVIAPGRPFNICALLTAVPRKGRGKSSEILWAYGIRARRHPITQTFGRISIQRNFFQMALLVVWKCWSHGGASSKYHGQLGACARRRPGACARLMPGAKIIAPTKAPW